jgi:CRP-like cAMP-binding protein
MNKANGHQDERPLIERALRWTEGFSRWPEHCLSELSAAAELRRYERGDLIASPDGEVRVVLAVISGYMLARRIDAVGARSSFDVIGPGQVVEMTPALGVQDNSEFDYVAHSDAVIARIPAPALLHVLETDPSLWKDALRMALREQREAFDGLIDRFVGGLRQRLTATIDRLATLHGVSEGAKQSLRLRLTQEDLAAMLQVSRQSINRELQSLHRCGVVSPDYNSLTILDRGALRAAAGRSAHVN